jgi:glucose-1-phosphate thymidylyltransferase
MKIIIPMAGMGKRMRPHTLTVPKPLIPVAGKPIVYRLVEDLAAMVDEQIEEIGFVIGDFGKETEQNLLNIAARVGAEGKIYYQHEPLGTAHAILCAKDMLNGHVIVAFADTLFYADFKIDTSRDGILWTSRIPDPSSFGVVETSAEGKVTRLWEKPKEFVSDQAIIGIYYFNDGENLRSELQYLLDNNITAKGEYQLTDALSNMVEKGASFTTAPVTHWLDCGNKEATLGTNKVILELSGNARMVDDTATITHSIIIAPCYIGANAVIQNSVIGPFASIGNDTKVSCSVVSNSIIMNHSKIKDAVLEEALIGNHASYSGRPSGPNLGDYSEVKA